MNYTETITEQENFNSDPTLEIVVEYTIVTNE